MSATSLQTPLFEHEGSADLPTSISELLRSSGGNKWQGTASELCAALCLSSAPRSLAVQLKKYESELQNVGVYVKRKKLHGRHIINLSLSDNVAQNVTKRCTSTHSTYEAGIAKVVFPFSWRYGTLEELSEEEKHELKRPVLNGGRKYHYRHCSICGEGVIEYRKESDISTVLLCRECAEDYVRKALRIVERDFQYRFKEDRRIK